MIVVGLTSKRHEGAVAVGAAGRLLGVCGDDRVTRERAGSQCGGWPAASLVLMLERLGHTEGAVGHWVVAGDDADARMPAGLPGTVEVIAPHLAHASTAYRTSPFASAAIVVCDHKAPEVSVWAGDGGEIRQVDWPWAGRGFAAVYADIAAALGLGAVAPGQRLEALARLAPDVERVAGPLVQRTPGGLTLDAGPRRRHRRHAGHRRAGRTAGRGRRGRDAAGAARRPAGGTADRGAHAARAARTCASAAASSGSRR